MTDKAEDAFRTIGEMAQELGVKPHILRYWEDQFPMLQPLKRAGGRRHYRASDAILLRTIRTLLQEQGYTIKGARQHLERQTETGSSADRAITGKRPSDDAGVFETLRSIRDRLAKAADQA